MRSPRLYAACALTLVFALRAGAQAAAPAAAAAPIPVRTTTAATISDSGALSSIMGVRPLSGGRLMVNDYYGRRLIILDSTMTNVSVIADTAAGARNNYGTSGSMGLGFWLGDSTLFADRVSQAFIIVDPDGKFGRVLSPPKLSDYNSIASSMYSSLVGVDPMGRIYYKGVRRPPPAPPGSGGRGAPVAMPVAGSAPTTTVSATASPDSAPILRGDFDARTADTAAIIGQQPYRSAMTRIPMTTTGGISGYGMQVINPLPKSDEWTLMPDGTIAVVRAQDYHVDWFLPDGTKKSTPKMPFDWRPISADEKSRIVDSAKRVDEERRQAAPLSLSDGTKFVLPTHAVDPNELPDYYPPVRAGQVKADFEGNLWVLPSTSTAARGALLYDIVNRDGVVFERVELPAGRNLLGFGKGGVVYMSVGSLFPTSPTAAPNVRIERATVARPPGSGIKQ